MKAKRPETKPKKTNKAKLPIFIAIGVVCVAIAVILVLTIGKPQTGDAVFDGVTNMYFGATMESVVAIDDQDYSSNATYKRSISDVRTLMLFDDGMRQYSIDNEKGLTEIVLYSTNQNFVNELTEKLGDSAKSGNKEYTWYGKLRDVDATMTVKSEKDMWKLTITRNK